jgi:tetrahydromethanopterin S-methyltransferase subunit B
MAHSLPKTWIFIAFTLLITGLNPLSGQGLPEVFQEGTLREQLDYIQNRTLIYENFRAVREDMFQKVKNNSLDSLNASKRQMNELSVQIEKLDSEIGSLSTLLGNTENELNTAIENRDNISLVGIAMNKATYNLIVWVIIGGLMLFLLTGVLLYVRNRSMTSSTLNEFNELKDEFEKYKVKSREQREKLVMEHFNEIKKFREQLSS